MKSHRLESARVKYNWPHINNDITFHLHWDSDISWISNELLSLSVIHGSHMEIIWVKYSLRECAARCKCQWGVNTQLHADWWAAPCAPGACSTREEGRPFNRQQAACTQPRWRKERNGTHFNCQGKLNHCFTFSQCRTHYHNILYVPWTWPSKPCGWVNVENMPLTLSTTRDFHLCINWPIMWDRSWFEQALGLAHCSLWISTEYNFIRLLVWPNYVSKIMWD